MIQYQVVSVIEMYSLLKEKSSISWLHTIVKYCIKQNLEKKAVLL